MADIAWLIRRLRAMSAPEVAWRISQKTIQHKEKQRFGARRVAVTESLFRQELSYLHLDADRLMLNWENDAFTLNTTIPLLGDYDYAVYKTRWNAGYQTENEWPLEFSYSLEYKQRDDIGDARTNWELNRHFQFALLAKNYYASRDNRYLDELRTLFQNWNDHNPFLWGISWTSVMEVAIRCSNWCYIWCFLQKAGVDDDIVNKLQIGILNMTDYIANHYSRYSSANNHLIVEAYAIGQTGVLCNYQPWIDLAVEILTHELPLQNYSDGINKELSLHYQSFYMEAMGLMMRLLLCNNIKVPATWAPVLDRMCVYVADCMGDHGETIVFGDDDEGKVLDLHGGIQHYQYVLGMHSVLLNRQYILLQNLDCENLEWLFTDEQRAAAQAKPLYQPPLSACYREGGNTILRSKDRRVLIGIDHAALGFGSIAAHGHADALSFQMYVDGQPVFVDPGTYIYHCDLNSRNVYRKTENHNTVCINGKDQSEMLGAFLWGKKAKCKLLDFKEVDGRARLSALHDGYQPAIHTRTFEYNGSNELRLKDTVSENQMCEFNLVLVPHIQIGQIDGNRIKIQSGSHMYAIDISGTDVAIDIRDAMYSARYGSQEPTKKISVKFIDEMDTVIRIGDNENGNCPAKETEHMSAWPYQANGCSNNS